MVIFFFIFSIDVFYINIVFKNIESFGIRIGINFVIKIIKCAFCFIEFEVFDFKLYVRVCFINCIRFCKC